MTGMFIRAATTRAPLTIPPLSIAVATGRLSLRTRTRFLALPLSFFKGQISRFDNASDLITRRIDLFHMYADPTIYR